MNAHQRRFAACAKKKGAAKKACFKAMRKKGRKHSRRR